LPLQRCCWCCSPFQKLIVTPLSNLQAEVDAKVQTSSSHTRVREGQGAQAYVNKSSSYIIIQRSLPLDRHSMQSTLPQCFCASMVFQVHSAANSPVTALDLVTAQYTAAAAYTACSGALACQQHTPMRNIAHSHTQHQVPAASTLTAAAACTAWVWSSQRPAGPATTGSAGPSQAQVLPGTAATPALSGSANT
jgi:hypothetical protein